MEASEIKKMYGWAEIDPSGPVVAGSFGTWRLTYHVGEFGIDDGGSITVANRYASDMGPPQTERPSELNYTTAQTSGKARLRVHYDSKGFARPWWKALRIDVSEHHLSPGETVTIIYGDRSKGSPGIQMQTFCEDSYEFKVIVDPVGTGIRGFVEPSRMGAPAELTSSPTLRIIRGDASRLVALLPSIVSLGGELLTVGEG